MMNIFQTWVLKVELEINGLKLNDLILKRAEHPEMSEAVPNASKIVSYFYSAD